MGNNLIKCLFFAFSCALFASCASLNKNVHTQTDNATHANFSKSIENDAFKVLGAGVTKWWRDSLVMNQKIFIRMFDTQTTDADGTHPILAEVEITTEQEQKIEAQETDTTSLLEHEILTENTDAQLTDTAHTESKEVIKKQPKTAQTFWSISVFGIVATIISLVVFYNRK